jgi:hypothetical protein
MLSVQMLLSIKGFKILKKSFKILLWCSGWTIGLIGVWLTFGHLLAAHKYKKLDRDFEILARQFPETQKDDEVLLKLQELTAAIGYPDYTNKYIKRILNQFTCCLMKDKQLEFEQIIKFNDYLTAQQKKTGNQIEAIPDELRFYLDTNKSSLEALYEYTF